MSSLKRLIDDDINDPSEQSISSEQLSRKTLNQGDLFTSDTPALVETSWDELWGEILSPDFRTSDISLLLNGDEANGATHFNIEEDIESWATQALPLTHDQFLHTQPISIEKTPAVSTLGTLAPLCYGMIYRTRVKLVGNMSEVDAKLKASSGLLVNDCCTFKIGRSSDQLVLRFQDGTEFGHLNIHTSKALNELFDRPEIQFEALGPTRTILEAIGRSTKAADAVVRVNINVYGSEEASKDVGRHLSGKKVYLQRPDHQRPGSLYDNPHVLKFPDMQSSSFEYQTEAAPGRVLTSNDSENFRKVVSNVYASLTRGSKLNCVEGDDRVETRLLPHQQEALDFMVEREDGPITPEFCLWKPMDGDDAGWYRHAVTKAKSRVQSIETGGGILADEMGMGKSLSILALITKTLESSNNWVTQRNIDIHSESPARQRRARATLVIVPSAILINEWLNEIDIHLNGTLKTLKYHGAGRKSLVSMIEEVDIVLTTYHTLVVDFDDKSNPIHTVEWFRVVLDEAHIIRRQVTTFYRAVSELKARSRWCLTGTPIQNRLEDVGALFAFIRASLFHSITMFRKFVTVPFDESEERRAVATRNLTLLLDSLCLRRSRELLHLPEPQERIIQVDFSQEERNQYEQTKKMMNRALRERVGESHSKKAFGMFQVQLQLRILCNHGTYQHPFSWNKRTLLDEREDALCLVGDSGEVICSACRQPMPILGSNKVYRTYAENCAHILCSECLDENEEISGDTGEEVMRCPLCSLSGVPFTTTRSGTVAEERHDSYLRAEGHSSKMSALVSDIKQDLWTTKSIIFSCWTNTLSLIERYLKKESIPFSRIDGDCPLGRRQRTLDDFSRNSAIPVLIMTTGTGAFGLNLTSANRVFIIEPQWNPSVENQAISRAIRMRQEKSVLVTRYMVKGTVEQEMRSQQERKLRIAEIGNSTST